MKFLIAGLGNMDSEYFDTRHNIGFAVADKIAEKLGVPFTNSNHAHLAIGKWKGKHILLIKPTTYMNLSGRAVKYWMTKEGISKDNILVVLDDLNLQFGSLRMRKGGSDGGHNGLKDITEQNEGNDYPRLRVGIGNEFGKGSQVNYVLGKWNKKELSILPEIIELAADAALHFCFGGIANAMNLYNNKKIPTPD
jgi:PTH1 family peptidyl-tRNA hydrolase